MFDFETQSEYTIRVRTIDNGGLSFEKDIIVSILDQNE
jgi:hypothetical protein